MRKPVRVHPYTQRRDGEIHGMHDSSLLPGHVRQYPHPGKYEGEYIFAPYVHRMSQEGFSNDETGDTTTMGHYYVKMDLRGDLKRLYGMALQDGVNLNSKEREFLFLHPFIIIDEDDYGFVTISYFTYEKQWEAAWADIEARVAAFDETFDPTTGEHEDFEADFDRRTGAV